METTSTKKSTNIVGGKLAASVNCDNDGMMVREGLRVPQLFINHSVFEKSEFEKKELKKLKFKKEFPTIHTKPNRELSQHRLTIYMGKSNVKNYKSTHSFMCYKHEINSIISSLQDVGYKVSKVFYNCHKYSF